MDAPAVVADSVPRRTAGAAGMGFLRLLPALSAVSAGSGAQRSIGTITGPDLDVTQGFLYPVGRHYLVVNPDAAGGTAIIAAVTGQ